MIEEWINEESRKIDGLDQPFVNLKEIVGVCARDAYEIKRQEKKGGRVTNDVMRILRIRGYHGGMQGVHYVA